MHAPNIHVIHVVARCPDVREFFDVPTGATLISLAGRRDALADAHHGIAVEVKVHFEASSQHRGAVFRPPHSAPN